MFLPMMGFFLSWGMLSQPFSLFTMIFGVGLVVLAMAFMIRGKASFAKSK